jgi:ubiquinone/menaquinone biosynthesis C-methylase UbiE
MQRVDAPEILDSDACSPADVEISMRDIGRVNRWFGGVSTTQKMVERVARATGLNRLSLLEVAAGSGELPEIVQRNLARTRIELDVSLLDRAQSHLSAASQGSREQVTQSHIIVGDALTLPFRDNAFDLVSCNLFAHHLNAAQFQRFVQEGQRVSRRALLINDLVRHPIHLALAFSGFLLMRSRVAWLDGLTSVRRAYVPEEMRGMISSAFSSNGLSLQPRVEITRHYLFRMGVIVWKALV